ncbi:TIGR04100 family radical SAM protein [Harryflintia acetispora]|uniref:TIGR04100 family radical SAM protein n=1 Tax=Harryflintia acetispora TaxID=1849041 RepID=UPI003306D64C
MTVVKEGFLMTDILYTLGDSLYINLTNRCPCRCSFCIRKNGSHVGSAENLWFELEPHLDEVLAAFDGVELKNFKELVFCGYGEPICALEKLLEVCHLVRSRSDIPIRLNTNGLGDLIHKRKTAHLLEGLVDTVSISLNAPDEERYLEVTSPIFGPGSFQSMLEFALDCKRFVPNVLFTVVDVISPQEIERCRALAQEMDIPLRVREYIKEY